MNMEAKNKNHENDINFKLITAINEISALLLKSFDINNIDNIINEILKILGNMSRADRCFVWKNYEMGDSNLPFMKQIYEWVNEANKIEPMQDSEIIEFVPYDPDIYEMLSSGKPLNAIVKDMDEYNRTVLSEQDIKSILLVPIHIDDVFWGFVGLDNCHSEELWSEVEEKTLTLISFMITMVINTRKIKNHN